MTLARTIAQVCLALAALTTSATAHAQCDNGVPIGGTACARSGDTVQYRCLAGSTPGHSNWAAESCNGGTCQGTACTVATRAGCDNNVPIGGTACARAGDTVQYRCLSGSFTPGGNRWGSESCNGGTCQGTACTVATRAGCDNNVPIGGTACARQGDTVQYRCLSGSFTPGGNRWGSESCNGGTCQVSACTAVSTGRLRAGANSTDIGILGNEVMPRDAATLRAEVARALQRLRDIGVIDVRIWADAKSDGDLAFMAMRVGIVADEAAARGQRVTVTLFDAHRTNATDPETPNIPGVNDLLRTRFQQVVSPNRGKGNIVWSIGNEIVGPSNPAAFASWYQARVAELRTYTTQPVVAELVPGSVNHFDVGGAASDSAARAIIAASNFVSVHFYDYSDNPAGNSDEHEFASLRGWQQRAGTKFLVGEFGVCNFGGMDLNRRYERLSYWFGRLNTAGVRSVRIWQLIKDTPGHTDNCSFDVANRGPAYGDISPRLLADGWLVH